jgi:hypothetical protein
VASAEGFRDRLLALVLHLNERQLRLAAALEARLLGYGGVSAMAHATGMARGTIHRALEELQHPERRRAPHQVRTPGAGRKRIVVQHPRILKRLKELVEVSTREHVYPVTEQFWLIRPPLKRVKPVPHHSGDE